MRTLRRTVAAFLQATGLALGIILGQLIRARVMPWHEAAAIIAAVAFLIGWLLQVDR